MTEAEWFTATDAVKMLKFLDGRISERKLRLLDCACCRAVWGVLADECSRRAVEVAERYADGLAALEALNAARESAEEAARKVSDTMVERYPQGYEDSDDYRAGCRTEQIAWDAYETANTDRERLQSLVWSDGVEGQARFLRDLIGNPFRPTPAIMPAWLTWNEGTVKRLAEDAYEQRSMPIGTLDNSRLGLLADALEDAGCTDPDMLGHLRGPGPHVRGCWPVDLILAKE
jgi:hypothetical protein